MNKQKAIRKAMLNSIEFKEERDKALDKFADKIKKLVKFDEGLFLENYQVKIINSTISEVLKEMKQ